MAIWTFYDFVQTNDRNAISEWMDSALSVAAEEKIEARLAYLGGTERHEWKRPYFSPLRDCAGISEIRFDADKKQHRIFGFFGPARHEYTMLLGWVKKNGDYSHQCRTAIHRMNTVKSTGRRYIREHGT